VVCHTPLNNAPGAFCLRRATAAACDGLSPHIRAKQPLVPIRQLPLACATRIRARVAVTDNMLRIHRSISLCVLQHRSVRADSYWTPYCFSRHASSGIRWQHSERIKGNPSATHNRRWPQSCQDYNHGANENQPQDGTSPAPPYPIIQRPPTHMISRAQHGWLICLAGFSCPHIQIAHYQAPPRSLIFSLVSLPLSPSSFGRPRFACFTQGGNYHVDPLPSISPLSA